MDVCVFGKGDVSCGEETGGKLSRLWADVRAAIAKGWENMSADEQAATTYKWDVVRSMNHEPRVVSEYWRSRPRYRCTLSNGRVAEPVGRQPRW